MKINFNPFSHLKGLKFHQLTEWQIFWAVFYVFAGKDWFPESGQTLEDCKYKVGIFDYLTLGIPYGVGFFLLTAFGDWIDDQKDWKDFFVAMFLGMLSILWIVPCWLVLGGAAAVLSVFITPGVYILSRQPGKQPLEGYTPVVQYDPSQGGSSTVGNGHNLWEGTTLRHRASAGDAQSDANNPSGPPLSSAP